MLVLSDSNFFRFGISQTDRNFESGSDPLGTSKDFGWKGAGTLTMVTNGSNTYTYTGNTVADGDVLSLAFDADAWKNFGSQEMEHMQPIQAERAIPQMATIQTTAVLLIAAVISL